jgi:hypothetical protein
VGAAAVVESEPKMQSSRRTLPMDAGLIAVLRRASAHQARERLALGAGYADTGYIAVNEAGQPYTPGALTNMWHRLTTAAGCGRSGCTMPATRAGPRCTCGACPWR